MGGASTCGNASAPNDGTPLLEVTHGSPKKSDDGRKTKSSFRSMLLRRGSSVIAPFADDSGSAESIRSGLLTVLICGACIGALMPKNTALPSPWYRTVSSIIGYSYFLSWSISFYPQIVLNYQRKSTVGLSNDFSVINHAGYICYSIYTCSLFWSSEIQDLYKERNGPEATITVQSNDVAFALHALVLSFIWIMQIAYYGGFKVQPLSRYVTYALCATAGGSCCFALLVYAGIAGTWLDFMYFLSFIKVCITITKYVPQVILNAQRLSTLGWNIWNVTLDVMGGALSLLQLVLDSADMKDWTGISGNLAKLGLSFATIIFDAIFLIQHYILYHQDARVDRN